MSDALRDKLARIALKCCDPDTTDALDKIVAAMDRAALSAPPPVVPVGWQLVPVEPHPRLLNVLFGYWLDPVNNLKHRAIAAAEWRSMLAAAPQAPTQRDPADNQSQPQR